MTPLEACAWVDAAPTPQERARRKEATFHLRWPTHGLPVSRLRGITEQGANEMLTKYFEMFPAMAEYLAKVSK